MDMGDYSNDIDENIKIIKDYLGYNRSYYIGYAGATTQMLYAMGTREPLLKDRILKGIFLTPCTFMDKEPPAALEIWTGKLDIYEFPGSNWLNGDKTKACTVVNEVKCAQLDQYDNLQPNSVKANAHLAQMAQTKKFSKFAESWPDNKTSVVLDDNLNKFQAFPTSIYTMQFDETCGPRESENLNKEILKGVYQEDEKNYFVVPDKAAIGHTYFTVKNDVAALLKTDISISTDAALTLKTFAKEHLTKTGGYANPAGDYRSSRDVASTFVFNAAAMGLAVSAILI